MHVNTRCIKLNGTIKEHVKLAMDNKLLAWARELAYFGAPDIISQEFQRKTRTNKYNWRIS